MMVMSFMAVIAMGATFNSKQEAEEYVADLNTYSKLSVEVVSVESKLGSSEENVNWKAVSPHQGWFSSEK